MAVYQILVRNLEGKTRCLRFSSAEVSCEDVKATLAANERVPAEWQRLVSGTREFSSHLVAEADGFFPSCTLLLRLRGGKGGFGSLLRGAATKAGQKKTSNFDACRDMSGRRLRHVNAEKKLKEWKADAKERELEKAAEEFLKKQRKVEEEDNGVEKELAKFRKQSLQAREDIGSAVMDGLVEAAKLGVDLKRKKVEAVEFEVKKARTWSPDEQDENEDDSDEEEEAGALNREEVSLSVFDKDEASPSGSGGDEATAFCSTKDEAVASCSTKEQAWVANSGKTDAVSKRVYEQASSQDIYRQSRASEAVEIALEFPNFPLVTGGSTVSSSADETASDKNVTEPTSLNGHRESAISNTESADTEIRTPSLGLKKDSTRPLDFEDYNSSKHLEVLGLERLKMELQNRGLKCGGSLSERAARLFLLKTVPLDKLDKKLFAKPGIRPPHK